MKKKMISLLKKYAFPGVISIIVICYQAILYFFAKFTPFSIHVIGSSIDRKIPLIPIFIIPYVLWYLFLVVVPCLLYTQNKKDFYQYILANILVDTIATIIFVIYPTLLIRPEIEVNNLFTWILNLIYWGDTPALNCFPSVHCANCFVAIFIMIKGNKIKKKDRLFTCLFAVLIIFSTLFVKQHALIDVVGAFILSFIAVLFVKKTNLSDTLENKVETKKLEKIKF